MNHPLGQICALLAAISWALALVLFKHSSDRLSPLALTLFKNAIAIVLFGGTVALELVTAPQDVLRPGDLSQQHLVWLLLSALAGITFADWLFFASLRRIGVGIMLAVDCVYSPSTILFAWLLLAEVITPLQYFGGGLILLAVFVSSQHKPPPGRTHAQLVYGILIGAVSMSLQGLSVTLAKPILDDYSVASISLFRLALGTALLALLAVAHRDERRALVVAFTPSRLWAQAMPAAVLGTYLSIYFWMAGFKYTHASVAAMLSQTSVIFAIPLARLFLREPFDARKLASIGLAVCGVLVVTFATELDAWWTTQLVAPPVP
jgi:drug/metabolite transporter (DMT)-like permease